MRSSILIFCPRLKYPGGVSNFYRMLRPYFPDNVSFLLKRWGKVKIARCFFTITAPIRIFFYLLFHPGISTVMINPSLALTAVRRDMVSAYIITKIFHRNLAIFWHGWHLDCEGQIEKSMLPRFRKFFFPAKKMFVLSSQFRNKLLEWGFHGEVVLTTTCFENALLENTANRTFAIPKKDVNLLFLSRIEKAKGIFLVLDTFAILKKRNTDIQYRLCIAGDGNAMQETRDYAKKLQLEDIEFTGYLRGNDKYKVFNRSDIFFFPSHGEGMPCALLEAMGSGLYVVTRAVGGIPDFFKQPQMGFMSDSMKPEVFAEAIEKIVKDHSDYNFYCAYNRKYAEENFTASKVADFLFKHLSTIR